MKRIWTLALLAVLLLSGCGGDGPQTAHPEWDADWTNIGDVLAVEPPEGFAPGESKDLLSVSGLWYYTWVTGEARSVLNAEGEEADVYDAQLFLLLRECKDADSARSSVEEWLDREAQTYRAGEAAETEAGGQTWRLLPLLEGRAENPYTHGCAAFASRGVYAISAELLYSGAETPDAEAVLRDFLNALHY